MKYDIAKIKAEIKSIDTARQKLSDRIQAAAVVCAYHAHIHGDVTLAVSLCQAVGAGMKHEALRIWFAKYAPVNPNKETVLSYSKGKRLEAGAELDALMDKAKAEDWHKAQTEKPAEEWTLGGDLHKLLAKLGKAVENGYEPQTVEEQAAIAALFDLGKKVPKPVKAPKAAAKK